MTWVRRYLFTICLLTAVSIATGFAQFIPGSLPSDWSAMYGFAPRHFGRGDWLRLITSIFLTHDVMHFCIAVTMILLIVTWAERTFGSINTLCIFALSHLTSMLAFAIGVGALQWTSLRQSVLELYDFHDVGPSAGYYGCLGALLAAPQWKYKRSLIVSLLGLLTLRMIVSIRTMPESHALLSADIVHLIAMLAGMVIQQAAQASKVSRRHFSNGMNDVRNE